MQPRRASLISRMKIAILGTRGIPARYGGFETLADQLSRRLAERGHQVSVYSRKPFTAPNDLFDARIRRIVLPSLPSKHFDTLVHTFISVLHVLFTEVDVILICNVANSPFAWIPRLVGKPVALNVDGLDRKRRKWNFLGQWFLHFCEVLSAHTPTRVVTDANAIQDYYWRRYRKKSEMIAYGAEPPGGSNHLGDFGLSSRRYILYVARLEPENTRETVVECGIPFQPDQGDLEIKLSQLIGAPKQIEDLREKARQVARETYGWDRIVDQYESLFSKMLR